MQCGNKQNKNKKKTTFKASFSRVVVEMSEYLKHFSQGIWKPPLTHKILLLLFEVHWAVWMWHKRNRCHVLRLDNHYLCDKQWELTVCLSCRVLVFLVFLHQEEASVPGRVRSPHRTRRRWVTLFLSQIKQPAVILQVSSIIPTRWLQVILSMFHLRAKTGRKWNAAAIVLLERLQQELLRKDSDFLNDTCGDYEMLWCTHQFCILWNPKAFLTFLTTFCENWVFTISFVPLGRPDHAGPAADPRTDRHVAPRAAAEHPHPQRADSEDCRRGTLKKNNTPKVFR